MQNQPVFYPQRGTTFYADGRSVRPQVPGTVARSQGEISDYFHTGMVDGKEGDGLPLPLTMDLMRRGQERFNIFCSPCHSRVGNGKGEIVERGYYPAASFHSIRLQEAPLGHFFAVITNGYGAMPNYAAEIAPEDRWAIVAYIRALQLSQNAKRDDISPGQKIEPLHEVVISQGFPDTFLDVWIAPHRIKNTADPEISASSVPTSSAMGNHSAATAANADKATHAGNIRTSSDHATSGIGNTTAKGKTLEAKEAAPATPPVDIEAGRAVYMHNCAMCHQPNRAGLPPNIPSLIGIVPKIGAEQIHTVVTEGIPTGKPPMPAFTKLSEQDISNLIGFLGK